MNAKALAVLGAVLVSSAALCQDVTIASSGEPETVIASPTGDLVTLTYNRLGLSSGNLGAGLEERWTAFKFNINTTTTFDGVYIGFFSSTPPTTYGYKIYKDDPVNNLPDITQVVVSETGLDFNTLITGAPGKTWANGFSDDIWAEVIPANPITLSPGKYWMTVYGEDGNIPQFCGCYGGNLNSYAARKTTTGSSFIKYETNAFAFPAFHGINLEEGWQNLGATKPYNYSFWYGNEKNGHDLYNINFVIHDSAGIWNTGSTVTGKPHLINWPDDPPLYVYPGNANAWGNMAFDVVFENPADGWPQFVESVNLDTTTGAFTTSNIKNGTYNVKVYLDQYQAIQWSCTDSSSNTILSNWIGAGHSYLPVEIDNVTVTGGSVNLGDLYMNPGDLNLDSKVNLLDLSSVLGSFNSTTSGTTCPPYWDSYCLAYDSDYSGTINLIELSNVLSSFNISGPVRK